jgi:tetratricopeptide (TPR) repeat protein
MEVLAADLEREGGNHITVAQINESVADSYARMEDFPNAVEWYKKIVPIYINAFGKKDKHTEEATGKLGYCYKMLGQLDTFATYFEEAYGVKLPPSWKYELSIVVPPPRRH